MAEERVQRRLVAVLAADVVGYSRLIEADEEGTRARLRSLFSDLIKPRITADGGRIVKTSGDGILVEYPSAVDAVRNALDLQDGIHQSNDSVAEDRRILFRVGINVGDVIVEGDDIHGDGVNLAARLEALAEPGSVFVSGTVYDQVAGKLTAAFEDLGERSVKNISQPIKVFRVRPANERAESKPVLSNERSVTDGDYKPSIAVLPFNNMSGDPDQEYFADGMVEELITALSRFDWLRVVARNSCFAYKGRAVDVRQVARELDVRYVLEGSVRKASDRVRITGQLIDAATGSHLWADRFDGRFKDIFDLQDRVAESVVGAIEPKLRSAEIARARRKRPESLGAYDLYLRALPLTYAANVEDNSRALELLEEAHALEPDFASVCAIAALCYEQRISRHWRTVQPDDRARCVQLATMAVKAGRDDAGTLALAAFCMARVGHDVEGALSSVERAIRLNPNDPQVQGNAGWVKGFVGDQDGARRCFEHALRLSPNDPKIYLYYAGLAFSHFLSGRFDEAITAARQSVSEHSGWEPAHRILAASHAHLGRLEEAGDALAQAVSLNPSLSIESLRSTLPYQNAGQVNLMLDGLRLAGLPD